MAGNVKTGQKIAGFMIDKSDILDKIVLNMIV